MDFKRFLRAEWDRVAGYAFVLAGAVALVFGFVGVRTAADVIDEISYLVTGGIGAIFLLGVGATLLLSADLHDDFRKRDRVEGKLDAIHQALVERHPDLVVDVRPIEEPTPAVTPSGVLAVRSYRRLILAGGIGALGLFLAGALVTANQASTDHMAGGETGQLAAFAPSPEPVRGRTRLLVQPDLGTTGALYSLLGLGGVGLVAATRLLRWKGMR